MRWLLVLAALLVVTGAGPLCAQADSPDPVIEVASVPPTVEHPTPKLLTRFEALITAITIFALAVFVGYEVINKVPTTLHTPLMSGSNAISGITVVGAIIVGGYSLNAFSSFVGFLAIVLAMINIVGGFLVTHRMLSMFKRR